MRQGLRGAPKLAPDQGLVLDYPVVSEACVTMDGMEQPLDAVFVGDDGRVLRTACGLVAGSEAVCQKGTAFVLERSPHAACPTWLGGFVHEEGQPAPLTAPWIGHAPVLGDACGERAPAAVQGRVRLKVLVDDEVSDAAVRRLLSGAQGWWAPHGLWLTMATPPVRMPLGPMLHGVRRDLLARLEAEGLPASGADADAQRRIDTVVDDVVMGPWQALLAEHAVPSEAHDVVVVILPHIARPGSLGEALFAELRGLTVSPWLRPALPEAEQALYARLGLPEAFTPVVLIGTEPIGHLGPDAVDVTLAHELGHALGLPHVASDTDLMFAEIHRCVPALDATQAAALRGYERL